MFAGTSETITGFIPGVSLCPDTRYVCIIMYLTKEYILKYKTDKGAWTQPQLMALGVGWPPRKGWMDRVIGKKLTVSERKLFESKMTIREYRNRDGR